MNIAVLMGGTSMERNVSLVGGMAVAKELVLKGQHVRVLDPARGTLGVPGPEDFQVSASDLPSADIVALGKRPYLDFVTSNLLDGVDFCFLTLHGTNGEDGYIQALLDGRGIRYSGSKMLSSALAMNKAATKIILAAGGINTPQWMLVHDSHFDDIEYLDHVLIELGGEVVVKPNDQGSTVGMTIVHNDVDDLRNALYEARKYTKNVMVERYIAGREVTCAILGDQALPIIEIVPDGGFYDYKRKYSKGQSSYQCPAELPSDVADFVMQQSLTAHNMLGCTAFSRIDYRIDEDNVVYCLEVNTLPGFSATSLVPMAAKAAGIEFGDLCMRIIELS